MYNNIHLIYIKQNHFNLLNLLQIMSDKKN